ncbi:hypothetical protein [Paenibacillus terrae]|uniref:Uncharacterized protein n=1 Tax=Paenibacillus terrae TaxID=159743 RepID=A0A0D7WTN1_9BACL|nr:hypothetical protein [Paenibacillus terrae]KJD42354.1 hypothetical protein QD47_28670 [Paenibacillus terrae]
MVVKQVKANYHSYLNEIKVILDPVLTTMRTQSGQSWRLNAWLGPIKVFFGYFRYMNAFKAIKWASLPIIGPIIAGVVAGNYGHWPIWLCIVGTLLLVLMFYYLYVRSYIDKMATIGQPEFHVEAYKTRRPKEYEKTWAQFVNKSDFTFEGLYDIVNTVFSQNNHDPSSVAYIAAYSKSQHDFMQNTISDLKFTIDEKEEAIKWLEDELVKSENAVSYLIGIIKKVNENLYRYINDRLSLTDMDFVCGFSLYRKDGNTLKLILDKGTSGNSRDLNLDTDVNFAAVVAAKDEREQAHHNKPYPERNIVAFRMTMLEGETWVWCFHFDDDDERSLSLLLGNDIIESRQIRRVMHVFCLTLQKRQRFISEKEVDQDVEAN